MSKSSKWVELDDKKVRHVWKCETCGKIVTVSPDFYASSGTPICSNRSPCPVRTRSCEGNDLVYVRTEYRMTIPR
jgi:hypothetical protein